MLVARDYKGSASQLRRRIRVDGLRPHKTEAFFRLNTLPGEEAQCDWADFGRIRVGNTSVGFLRWLLCCRGRVQSMCILAMSRRWRV